MELYFVIWFLFIPLRYRWITWMNDFLLTHMYSTWSRWFHKFLACQTIWIFQISQISWQHRACPSHDDGILDCFDFICQTENQNSRDYHRDLNWHHWLPRKKTRQPVLSKQRRGIASRRSFKTRRPLLLKRLTIL